MRETVKVCFELGLELLLVGAGLEVAQCELRGAVEGLPRCLQECLVLTDDASLVERCLRIENVLLS